ncbi:hypothetical protein Pmar_PMAR003603 [Perkinsus marinus ATCC 50983]|uniref:Uncharacterized protein n=1 Tax=Perkinsus marinus (strain ATCC 50983 / TXsc) TaxID=423536 RepID=C5KHS8_PERM5|nr:hypothetical protein Pmar_PMAR003603 [Perkinsus marinus ATCC 50983]EER16140.1 hypothetical protein Pmar_PMAR003603 [Perkinsus marinus ATCC 50983]|eukprot:XP_002784344.1 hypothetical protein Pmar_PMAR003603 [Perkinsus marinus ATCC 50983]
MIGCRRVAIDVLNGLIFLLSIIMFYTAMGSLAHMDVNDLIIDPFIFKAIVQAIADHDGNYYDTHPEAEAHDYLVRYQRGFMKLWELAECVGGGCSTFDCSEEDPLHFQSVLCPMDTNFQTYLESLFLIANAELSDEFIMECRQWLIAEGQGPIPPPDTDPIAPEVADPYGTSVITSDDLLSDLSGGITACIWLVGSALNNRTDLPSRLACWPFSNY